MVRRKHEYVEQWKSRRDDDGQSGRCPRCSCPEHVVVVECQVQWTWAYAHLFLASLLAHFSFTFWHHDHLRQMAALHPISMSTSTWSRFNVQPTTDKHCSVSAKPLFLRSHMPSARAPTKTPIHRQPIVPLHVTKPRKYRFSDRRDSNRIQKSREVEKPQDPRAALADNFSGRSSGVSNTGLLTSSRKP